MESPRSPLPSSVPAQKSSASSGCGAKATTSSLPQRATSAPPRRRRGTPLVDVERNLWAEGEGALQPASRSPVAAGIAESSSTRFAPATGSPAGYSSAARPAGELGEPADRRGDHGQPRGHRLERGQAEALLVRAHHERVALREQALGIGAVAEERTSRSASGAAADPHRGSRDRRRPAIARRPPLSYAGEQRHDPLRVLDGAEVGDVDEPRRSPSDAKSRTRAGAPSTKLPTTSGETASRSRASAAYACETVVSTSVACSAPSGATQAAA